MVVCSSRKRRVHPEVMKLRNYHFLGPEQELSHTSKKIAVRLFAIAKGSLALKGLLIHVRFFVKGNSIKSCVIFKDVSLDKKEGSAMAAVLGSGFKCGPHKPYSSLHHHHHHHHHH